MSRSVKKGPFIDQKLARKIEALKNNKIKEIKTWSRQSTIFPEMTGISIGVHNGKDFINVQITEEMVGHKLGEFAPTRKFIKHGGRIAREEEAEILAKESAKVDEPTTATKEIPTTKEEKK